MGGETYCGWFVEWIEEWSQFLEPCNWRTFHVAFIELEDDRSMGAVEATLILFGLGIRWRWNYIRTEKSQDILDQIEALNVDDEDCP